MRLRRSRWRRTAKQRRGLSANMPTRQGAAAATLAVGSPTPGSAGAGTTAVGAPAPGLDRSPDAPCPAFPIVP